MNDQMRAFVAATDLSDGELRRELAAAHQMADALDARVVPDLRALVQRRCDELDAEYLARFPGARAGWPWPVTAPVSEVACATKL